MSHGGVQANKFGWILQTLEAFPVSYNEAMVRGWACYSKRALIKMFLREDEELSAAVDDLVREMTITVEKYLDNKDEFRKLDPEPIEKKALRVQDRIVALGLLPKLDDLTLDDVIETQ